MSIEHKDIDFLKGKFEDGDRPVGEDFARLIDSCHNTYQDTDVTITGTLETQGATTLVGATHINSSLRVDTTFDVIGESILHGVVSVLGDTLLDKKLTVTGTTTLKSACEVLGATVLRGQLAVNDAVSLSDTLTVQHATNLQGALNVTGLTTLHGRLSASDTIHVAGDMHVAAFTNLNTLNVAGFTNTSDINITGEMSVTDDAVFDSDVHIKGNITVDGEAYLNADVSGTINVGDTDQDNVSFRADVNSDVNVRKDATYNLGSVDKKWSKLYVDEIVVDGVVDGRDVSQDGDVLDTLSQHSNKWSDTHSVVSSTSGDWNTTRDIVDTGHAGWNDTRTVVQSNSSDWLIDKLVNLHDVDGTGIQNNSILRYESSTEKWVASTVEDETVKATAELIVYDHGSDNEIPVDGLTLILTDNHQAGPYRIVTFTADSSQLSGTNNRLDEHNYTYGTSGLSAAPTDQNLLATLVTDVINVANDNGDLDIVADSAGSTIVLLQQNAGPGGNTDITGTAVGNSNDAFLHGVNTNAHHPAFTGGANLNSFASLDDTPAGYGADANKFVKVNTSNNGLEFVEHDSNSWDAVVTTVRSNSASWEETADIQALSNSISTSGDWVSTHTTVNTSSADWNSTYTGVNAVSANWDTTHTTVSTNSAEWESTYSTTSTYSGDWEDAHSTVQINSGGWQDAYTDVGHNKTSWSNTYTSVRDTSANWSSTHTNVNTNSANWNSTHTNVNTNSANWSDVHNFVSTTSGTGTGFAVLDATGKVKTDQIPELSITSVHTAANPGNVAALAPAGGIQRGDVVIVTATYDNLIAFEDNPSGTYDSGTKLYDGYNKLRLPADLVQTVNGNYGPSVTLDSDDIPEGAVKKFVTSTQKSNIDTVYNTVWSNSASWEETADIQALANAISVVSGDWASTHTTTNTNSADWESTYISVNAVSASWDSTHTTVNINSADWNSAHTTVNTSSGQWNDTHTWVSSDSATNNTAYNNNTYVNVSGDTMTGTLQIVGGELEVGGNVTVAGDLIHQNDTGTRVSFSPKTITLEANGDEYITIDATNPTPNAVIVNDPASDPVHFMVRSTSDPNAFHVNGATGSVGIGTSATNHELVVMGTISATGDTHIDGTCAVGGEVQVGSDLKVTGEMLSAGTALHEIFSTSTNIVGDLTVNGDINTTGDTFTDGKLSGSQIHSTQYQTTTGANVVVSGVTQDVNIGGHILHIVNGLIVGVTDE